MDIFENSGEVTTEQSVSEEAAVSQEQTETTTALDEFMREDAEQESNAETVQEQEDNIPKGIRGRIQAAETKADKAGYTRGRQEAENEYKAKMAEYESKLSKYAEMELDNEAAELARQEHCSVSFAKRMLRLEKGMKPVASTEAEKPKTVEASKPSAAEDKAKMLYEQANRIQENYGIDVLSVFKEDPDVKAKIGSGEWDFNDVALHIMSSENKPKATPAPVRNGGSNRTAKGGLDFSNMTDEEFDRFNEKIRNGGRYTP